MKKLKQSSIILLFVVLLLGGCGKTEPAKTKISFANLSWKKETMVYEKGGFSLFCKTNAG